MCMCTYVCAWVVCVCVCVCMQVGDGRVGQKLCSEAEKEEKCLHKATAGVFAGDAGFQPSFSLVVKSVDG